MELLVSIAVGCLTAATVYLMLDGNLIRFLFGLVLFSNAINLLLLSAGRLTRITPPFVPAGFDAPPEAVANPLSQALILTAIVIGFGLASFTLILILRASRELGTVITDRMLLAEPPERPSRVDEANSGLLMDRSPDEEER